MTTTRTLCAVERHPQYEEILNAMANKQTDQQISHWLKPSLDRTTLWRFRKNKFQERLQRAAHPAATVAQSMQELGLLKDGVGISQTVRAVVAATTAALAGDPIRSRIEKHQKTLDLAIVDARDEKDARGVAALIKTDLSGLELDARLTGRLDGPGHVTVNNLSVLMMPKCDPEPEVIDIHAEAVTDGDASEPK